MSEMTTSEKRIWAAGEDKPVIGEIDHIEIETSNADEMAEFLQVLGFEKVRETDHHGTSYELEPGHGEGPLFEIHTATGEEVPGINHIAFAVDDIESATEELREAGVDQVTDPYYVEKTGRMITNFRDPDGRRFQVVADEDDE